jgi:hypothetical protein
MCGADAACDPSRKKQHMLEGLAESTEHSPLHFTILREGREIPTAHVVPPKCERKLTAEDRISLILARKKQECTQLAKGIITITATQKDATIVMEVSWQREEQDQPKDPAEASALLTAFAVSLQAFLQSIGISAAVSTTAKKSCVPPPAPGIPLVPAYIPAEQTPAA